jgi:cell division protein ZapD
MKYEFPLNEKIRAMLRLEYLFTQWDFYSAQDSNFNHHSAILVMFEINEMASRIDLRTDLSKELEKQIQTLTRLRNSKDIDIDAINVLIYEVNSASKKLKLLFTNGIASTIDKDWLTAIKNRTGIPGGTCQSDLPSYYAWQQNTPDFRKKDLAYWIEPIIELKHTNSLVLNLLRCTAVVSNQITNKAIYQQALSGKIFQLLQIELSDEQQNKIPEVSGNKYMITIRFQNLDDKKNLCSLNLDENIEFKLHLCSF